MKRFSVALSVFSAVALLLTTGALAQMSPPEPVPRAAAPATPAPKVTLQTMPEWYGSKLIGMDVKNPQGQALGEIDDLVLDSKDAKLKSVVISTGGMLGIGAKKVEVPWDQLKPASDEQAFIVAMTKEELQQAPGWQRATEKVSPATPSATIPRGTPGQ
jgi:sporulation protein YlmC with PRC-barrel domain